jgi:hypothetical protein
MAGRLAALAATAILASGCGTSAAGRAEKAETGLSECESATRPWVGRTEAELLQAFGAPVTTSRDGKNGRILEYHLEVDLGRESHVTGGKVCLVGLLGGSSVRYTLSLKRDFFLDEAGRIYLAKCLGGPTQMRFGG